MVVHSQETAPLDVLQANDRPLSKRDWVVLLCLGLVTACIVISVAELVARKIFSESKTSSLNCMILNDPKTGVRAIPNSVCWQKDKEGPPVEYRFNECGDRANLSCGSKTPNTFRIVSIGASISEGFGVAYDKTFVAQLPRELSQLSGRKYELYNEALEWGGPQTVNLRFADALSAKPDLILWTIHPLDIEMPLLPWWITQPPDNEPTTLRSAWQRIVAGYRGKPISLWLEHEWERIVNSLNQTSTMFLLQHLFYLSESQYVKSYLQNDNAGFLMRQSSASWKPYWQQFDRVTADIASSAEKAGVPLVVAVIPQRAQAVLISTGNWPAGVDPYAFGDKMKSVVESHGAIYLDLLSEFREIPNPGRLYYPVDGHLNADGQSVIARLLATKLADGIIPGLKHTKLPFPALQGG
jgi:hypothetical protein